MLLLALRAAATVVYCAWLFGAILMSTPWRNPLARWIYHEFKPLFWPAYVIVYGPPTVTGHLDWVDIVGMAGGIANWFFYKDIDDDDRWKRRRRKVVERIQAVGGRLTVVADGTS